MHDATPAVARQLGAVLIFEDAAAEMPLDRLSEHVRSLIAQRATELPMLAHRLVTPPDEWPRWVPAGRITATEHLAVRTIGAADASWHGVMEEFFGTPLRTDAPPWMLAVVRDTGTGRTGVLAKMHHALGDGLAMTDTLIALLSDQDPSGPPRAQQASRRSRVGLRRRAVRAAAVVRGLASLVPVGLTRVGGLGGAQTSQRRYAALALPAAQVRAVARQRSVSTSAVLLAAVAEGLHRMLSKRDDSTADRPLRAMVPRSTRAARSGADGGNWTAAVSLDLPIGPMSPAQRLDRLTARMAALDHSGQPAAITAVLRTLGRLPTGLQSRLVGLISGNQFFDLIVSVMPGSRRAHRMAGMRVSAVFPMLPLGRVGLAVGMMNWADVVGVGITADAALLDDADELAACVRAGFDELGNDFPQQRPSSGTEAE